MSAPSESTFSAHCAALGLRTVRTIDELNAAYRPLIRQWHPDRHHDHADHAIALVRATAINEAYAFLSAALANQRTSRPVVLRRSRSVSDDGFPDASVLEIFVKPSSIISVGYNSATADLFVKFVGHRVYRYIAVPLSVFEALLMASSAAVFVGEQIDRRYECEVLKRTT
ncbi:KTSC domain-containing protein [Gemmatimonas sp.]|uniref:KTSC domain-containing protein n=1 Tax=Gemmatimonas sp. TaxID=1962908 RepID=UPI00356B2926